MFAWIKTAWEKTKVFFNRAWSIFLARAQLIIGVAVAGLAASDWGPVIGAITTSGVTKAQAVTLGAFVAVQGLLAELARRAHTKTLDNGQLIPANVEAVKLEGSTKVKKVK